MAASHVWEKELQKAVKTQHQFGWSVREKRGKVCIQRYYKDTNKKYAATLDIAWESGQTLAVLSALRKINDAMVANGINLKEAVNLFSTENEEAEINWNEAINKFKKYKLQSGGCSESTWNSNYKNVVERIIEELNSKNAPQSGLGILEKLKHEKDGRISFGKGRRRRILSAKQFLNYAVHKCAADVLVRYNAGQSIPQDEQKLFDAGLTNAATAARVRGQQLDDAALQKTAELGRKRYLEERKRAEQFSNASYTERLAMSGALSPEAIARNKAAYGITE